MKITYFILIVLFFIGSINSSAQSMNESFQDGKKALENTYYKEAYNYFTEAIYLYNKDGFNNKNILSIIYYNRALSSYYIDKNDKSIIDDLDNSILNFENTDAILLYGKLLNQLPKEVLLLIDSTNNTKQKEKYLAIAYTFAYFENDNNQAKAFEYLEKALNAGYNDTDFLLNNSDTFLKLGSDVFLSLYSKYLGKVPESFVYKISQEYLIKFYVEKQINQWQKKGKFEKTTTFQKRVNEQTREKQIVFFTQYYIDSIGMTKVNLKDLTNEYDADNEVFKVNTSSLGYIYIPVPIGEAQLFDKNFNDLEYENATFTLYNNNFEMLHLEVVNPGNNKRYIFDSENATAFSSNQLVLNFDEIDISLDNIKPKKINREQSKTIVIGKADVDINIPITQTKNNSAYALIIGNEDYQSYQTGLKAEQNVEFAVNDARVFKKYCINTLAIPEQNIIYVTNAGVVRMKQVFNQLNSVIKNLNGEAEITVFYAGHGYPNEQTKEPYLMPVDVSSNSLGMALNLKDIYKDLTKYPSKRVLVFLDACFTGGGREMGLFASRGVSIKPKENELKGNLVVFSASSGKQSSLPYYDKGHGMFTYYLLKKLQETKGNTTLGDLDQYLSKFVSVRSSIVNGREQNPTTNTSMDIINDWKDWKVVK